MTDLEKEIRYMLNDKEVALLDRVLADQPYRDGMIGSLVARELRRMVETGVMDVCYPEQKTP